MMFTGLSAVAQIGASRTQASGLEGQASYRRLEAKQEELKNKQQAIAVLDNMLATASTINAYGGIGMGNIDNLDRASMAKGVTELYNVEDNAIIALKGGYMQADQYMMQASATRQAGFASAIGSIGSGLMMKGSIG